jgi:hypothetical protein
MKTETILKRLKNDTSKCGLLATSKMIPLSYGTLWNILNTGEIKTMRILRKLEAYYGIPKQNRAR